MVHIQTGMENAHIIHCIMRVMKATAHGQLSGQQSLSATADYEPTGKYPEGVGPQLVKLLPRIKAKRNFVRPAETDMPLQLYTKRVGFNDIVVSHHHDDVHSKLHKPTLAGRPYSI